MSFRLFVSFVFIVVCCCLFGLFRLLFSFVSFVVAFSVTQELITKRTAATPITPRPAKTLDWASEEVSVRVVETTRQPRRRVPIGTKGRVKVKGFKTKQSKLNNGRHNGSVARLFQVGVGNLAVTLQLASRYE